MFQKSTFPIKETISFICLFLVSALTFSQDNLVHTFSNGLVIQNGIYYGRMAFPNDLVAAELIRNSSYQPLEGDWC